MNQSVFETSSESFSQSDLATFQNTYSLTKQRAIDVGGFEISSCTVNTCGEGNLDIQYIMGVAQVTNTLHAHMFLLLYAMQLCKYVREC